MAEITIYVDGGHQQLSVQHVGLNHQTQFPADVPRVYGLHDGLIVARESRKVHHLHIVH